MTKLQRARPFGSCFEYFHKGSKIGLRDAKMGRGDRAITLGILFCPQSVSKYFIKGYQTAFSGHREISQQRSV